MQVILEIKRTGAEYDRALEINRVKIIVGKSFALEDFLYYLQKQEAIKWQK